MYKAIFSSILVTIILFGVSVMPNNILADTNVQPESPPSTHRLSGTSRYTTAVNVAKRGWTTAATVVITNGEKFTDSLVAGPLAAQYKSPLLLASIYGLDADTLQELKSLKTKNIVLVGSISASSVITNQLISIGIGAGAVSNINGATDYDTSIAVAQRLTSPKQVIVASGESFADALSVSAIANKLCIPIIVSPKDGLTKSEINYITALKPSKTYIIGGTGALSSNLEEQVPNAVRISGIDRYDTNLEVLKQFNSSLNYSTVYLCTGSNFADALAGSVLAGSSASPVILVEDSISDSMKNYLKDELSLDSTVIGLGGEAVLPSSVIKYATDIKTGVSVSKVFDKSGSYTDPVNGNAIISAGDITLKGNVIAGDLLISSSVGNGSVTLSGVRVNGKIIINGGGDSNLVINGVTTPSIVIDKPQESSLNLITDLTSNITSITARSSSTLSIADSTNKANIAIGAGVNATLKGNIGTLRLTESNSNINIVGSSLDGLVVSPTASQSAVNIDSTSSIKKATIQSETSLAGDGLITSLITDSTTANLKLQVKNIDKITIDNLSTGITISTTNNSIIKNLYVLAKSSITGAATILNTSIGTSGVVIDSTPATISLLSNVTATVGGKICDSTNSTVVSLVVPLPNIVSVSMGNVLYVAQNSNGLPAALPTTTVATLSDGTTINIPVTFVTTAYSTFVTYVGSYVLIGNLTLPSTVTNTDSIHVTQTLIVTKAPATTTTVRNISSINPLTSITASTGTQQSNLGLPTFVNVTLDDNSILSMPIVFSTGAITYDYSKKGNYLFLGHLTLPSTITNTYGLSVYVGVTLVDPTLSK